MKESHEMEYPEVILNARQMIHGAIEGCLRQIRKVKQGSKHRHGYNGKTAWQVHIEGALKELALSMYLQSHWLLTEQMYDGDVSGLDEVRSSEYDGARVHLIVHPDDKDDRRYWLVTGSYGSYAIRGYKIGREAKQEKYWGELQPGRPAFNVPCDELDLI
jgi:hypothetical protein